MKFGCLTIVCLLAACGAPSAPGAGNEAASQGGNAEAVQEDASRAAAVAENAETSREAMAANVVAEPAIDPKSAEGAAQVVQTYYALIEARRYGDAQKLRWNAEELDPLEFAHGFAGVAEYHATIGKPSEIEGAAGSSYVEVPVQIYGRRKDGTPIGSTGTVTLRRVNDVPGSTAEQRLWRIYTSE
jgi:hypothetical protein